MDKENSGLKILLGLSAAVFGYSMYKLIKRGSLKDVVSDSPIIKKRRVVEDTGTSSSEPDDFTITFMETEYIIKGTDVMMTAEDFIVNVLKGDPEEIAIGEIVPSDDGSSGAGVLVMNMQDPIDLHQMMLNEAPRYVTVPFSEIPNAKDSVTNKKKKFEEKSIKSDANVKESVKSKSSDSNPDEDGYYLISVNGSKLFSETKSLTGIQIKRKIGVREQDSLWIVSDEQDILVNNIQSIDLKTYEKAEFYTGKCKNGPNVGDIAETKKPQHPGRTPGRKTTPRTITVNGKAMTWGKSRITGMDIKRMVPAAITKPHHYEVYQTFTRKDSKPVGDGTMITLWVNQKFAFDVREIGGGHD